MAGAGVKVAKHGNRSLSSQCGSADILEALRSHTSTFLRIGSRSASGKSGLASCLLRRCILRLKHAQAARIELKMRTAFNLLGPLLNPACPTVQVVGAPSLRAAELVAEALASLGMQRGFVVHGLDGLDEITTTAETRVLEIRGGAIAEQTAYPGRFRGSHGQA